MLQSLILSGLALLMLANTSCTIKGTGSQRYNGKSANAADASAGAAKNCLTLAEKKKELLKLQEEGEEKDDPAADPAEESAEKETDAEEPAGESPEAPEGAAEGDLAADCPADSADTEADAEG